MARKPDVGQLRNDAANALERGKLDKAIELYQQLEAAEPSAPAWPKKIGEIHRRAGDAAASVAAFERAAEKYALAGFLVQAIAVCKMILQIQPEHSATQLRLSELMPKPARPATKPLRADTAPLVYDDDGDDPVRDSPRAEAAPATSTSSTATPTRDRRDRHLAAAANRIRDDKVALRENLQQLDDAGTPAARTSTRDIPVRREDAASAPTARTSTRDLDVAGATARVRDDKAAKREVLRARHEASTRDPKSEAEPPSRPTRPLPQPQAPEPSEFPVRPPTRLPRPAPKPRALPMPSAGPPFADTAVPRGDEPRTREPSLPVVIVDRPLSVEIPPGGGLDQIDLSTLIPGSVQIHRDDGTYSGVNVLPLGEGDDIELSLDEAEPVTDRTPGRAARRALLTTPLFPQVSPRVLEQLIEHMSLRDLAPDEILFREGETGNELFVISEGEVAVESQGVGELARLGPSAFFGEIALVTDLPRSATIRAITRVELLTIDRGVMREASKDHPEIITVLLRFVRDRLIDRITRTSELFAPFTEAERQALSAKFELVEVVPDAILITQGERADGLYLVVAGAVEVWRDGGGVLATLGTGDVFGELSLLAGGGSTANVRATTRVLALRMPASTFQEVIMTHPQVLAYLGELAERRAPRGEAEQFVDLHLDMLV